MSLMLAFLKMHSLGEDVAMDRSLAPFSNSNYQDDGKKLCEWREYNGNQVTGSIYATILNVTCSYRYCFISKTLLIYACFIQFASLLTQEKHTGNSTNSSVSVSLKVKHRLIVQNPDTESNISAKRYYARLFQTKTHPYSQVVEIIHFFIRHNHYRMPLHELCTVPRRQYTKTTGAKLWWCWEF